MAEPDTPQKSPYVLNMDPGTYYWCSCGKSASQPYCDGSHAGTDFEPLEFVVDKPTTLALCGCKRTSTPPYCDGTHSGL